MKHAYILLSIASIWFVSSTAMARRVTYAITIGNNAPPADNSDLKPLRYADDDAVRYYELFRLAGPKAELLTVLDRQSQRRYPNHAQLARLPTLSNLRQVLKRYKLSMRDDIRRGDQPILFLTFSGHGDRSGQGIYYLSLLDARLTQAVLYKEVLTFLPDAQINLIVDACHASAVVGVRGAFDKEIEGERVPLTENEASSIVKHTSLQRFPNVGALMATTVDQEAHEWSQIQAGVFTHEVISALLGAADINGDRRIVYSEVSAFISAANHSVRDTRAIPRIFAHPPASNHNAVLIELNKLNNTVFLRGNPGQLGHFYIELENGQRLLDAHLSGDSRLALALPRGKRSYLRTETEEALVPVGVSGEIQINDLDFQTHQMAARGSLDASYRQDLFSTAFSPAYYLGFIDNQGISGVPFVETREPKPMNRVDDSEYYSAIGLFGLSAVALITAGVTGYLALSAKDDFDDTQMQKKAHELNQDYQLYGTTSIFSAMLGVAAGVFGWWFWPSAEPDPNRQGALNFKLQTGGKW